MNIVVYISRNIYCKVKLHSDPEQIIVVFTQKHDNYCPDKQSRLLTVPIIPAIGASANTVKYEVTTEGTLRNIIEVSVYNYSKV